MQTLIGYTWFTQMGNPLPIGIVITRNDAGERRAFIGLGSPEYKDDSIGDAAYIGRTGATFPLELAEKMIEV